MIVYYGLNNGAGIERVCSMIANGLSESGHEVIVGSYGPSDKPFFPLNKNINIIPLLDFPNNSLGRLPITAYKIKNINNTAYRLRNKIYDVPYTIYNIRKLLKKERIDIIIAVDIMSVQFTLPATLGLKIKHIAWEHFNFSNEYISKDIIFRKLAARYCDSVITLTEEDKKCWLENTNHNSQIRNIPNPCPFPIQDINSDKKTEKIVLAVGRLYDHKGFDLLLQSWIKVTKIMPEWKLKIVGEGVERAKLTEFIEENRLTDSVELVGKTNDISKFYKEAQIFCLSSRVEGFGMVLTEALAFGIPIVSFDCGPGPAEVLKDTGSILVPKNDVNQFALSLIDLMQDEQSRKAISLKGKKKVEIYQPDNIINEWLELINSFS